MKKICHVIFSTNRLSYLTKTLESQKNNLNFEGTIVHKLFIDDYPRGRDNYYIANLVKSYGFDEIILHSENLGLTTTWHELFLNLRERDYDYIFHQEDDVIFNEPVNVAEIVEILESQPQLSQIQFKRNNWYPHETQEFAVNESDINIKDGKYYIEEHTPWFWMLASIYPKWISHLDFNHYPSEVVVGSYLLQHHNLVTGLMKNSMGKNIVEHIGEISTGKRVNRDEVGWDKFKNFDPNKNYMSRTGKVAYE